MAMEEMLLLCSFNANSIDCDDFPILHILNFLQSKTIITIVVTIIAYNEDSNGMIIVI